jgi:hypothetical protein
MQFQDGDWVESESGLRGRIIHVSRLSAFVELEQVGGNTVVPFLLSEIKRIDPPDAKELRDGD